MIKLGINKEDASKTLLVLDWSPKSDAEWAIVRRS